MSKACRVLISNDDGILAIGVRTLANTLAEAGHHVTVVCPDRERSATGHGLTIHQPIRVDPVADIYHASVQAWACSGTPSDCVKLALSALLKEPPDFVLSGINQGANLGTDVLYSGTVSAAMEGAIEGFPSIAFSLTSFQHQDFSVAARFAVQLLAQLIDVPLPEPALLNVNIPPVPESDIVGVALTRQGLRRYREQFEQRYDPRGKGYYWLAGEAVEEVEQPIHAYVDGDIPTDVEAIRQNYITLTPLQYDLSHAPLLKHLNRDRLQGFSLRSPNPADYDDQHPYEWCEVLPSGLTIDMITLPRGQFWMGSKAETGYREESPRHRVQIAPVAIGKYPVTQAQWRIVAQWDKVGRELNPEPAHFRGDDHPVENITWLDAVEFCARLSLKTGKLYRLPTEAEWEYACRAGTETPFFWGEHLSPDHANYRPVAADEQSPWRESTTPVTSFAPNAFGLHDCHGNVWEWCSDRWHSSYQAAPQTGRIWDEQLRQSYSTLRLKWLHTPPNSDRVLRGGSWYSNPMLCRSASRYHFHPYNHYTDFIGMRLACGEMLVD